MAKSKRVKLTSELIENQDSQYNKLKKITFDDGAWTEIYLKFKPSKIEECVEDFADFLVEYEKHGSSIVDDKEFYKFLYLYIVQHFSTLVPNLPADFPTRLGLMNKLANNKYVIALDEHFDKNQIEKMYEIMFKKIDTMKQTVQHNYKLREQLLSKIDTMDIEHKDTIKDMLGVGNG